jgi:hypothetical protein
MSRLEASGGPVGAAGLPAIVEQARAAAEGGAVERERAAVEALAAGAGSTGAAARPAAIEEGP